MVMRFHWGLAVGHAYTHDSSLTDNCIVAGEVSDEVLDDEDSGQPPQAFVGVGQSEFSLDDCENPDWDDSGDDEADSVSDIDF
jgi:hypothetical protein